MHTDRLAGLDLLHRDLNRIQKRLPRDLSHPSRDIAKQRLRDFICGVTERTLIEGLVSMLPVVPLCEQSFECGAVFNAEGLRTMKELEWVQVEAWLGEQGLPGRD